MNQPDSIRCINPPVAAFGADKQPPHPFRPGQNL
jgi:hypothetical protein